MSRHERPYDENQLQKLTEAVIEHGPVVAAHPHQPETDTPASGTSPHGAITVEIQQNQEASSKVPENDTQVAVSGLRRLFTRGRISTIREKRAEARARRAKVAQRIADRILYPRQTDNIKENIGWVGTHKIMVDDHPELVPRSTEARLVDGLAHTEDIKTDMNNLGGSLMIKKAGAKQINELRPRTKAEQKIHKRLEKQTQKMRRHERESRWLDQSLKVDGAPIYEENDQLLSRTERKHVRKTRKRQQKHERKADITSSRFQNAIDSRNGVTYRSRNTRDGVMRTIDRVKGLVAVKQRPAENDEDY